ncbi:vacuolar protein sorting associated protein [Metschnikowia bicuspidata var. bicuspidata NRRL YB-4993]|uniref:Vacuolar protein sorting associated protein n=1 Tax=Metschnikowia bicuspidata var. bicuspidata NRRL YB-4993 TaxID=869754 RepID=A0A1A0HFP6_9ASCO|nr:vacuolar protein sorting associated protein [Metschnikowia bicuspidata var. bicuspidata NRRL YB-4993]OBA22979.1 vacuolar protein sorting associated protein [Metschnikowia bicuspidata var. bicuspidata NRRL YB-4993]
MPPTLSLNRVSEVYFEKLFVAKNNTALAAAVKAKVLLVDRATMPIISMSFSQSQLLQQDVILIEMLENTCGLSAMKHLNCVVYIKPQRSSIAQLCAELGLPHYSHYQLFFSHTVAKADLEKIALADEYEVINQVAEVFQDYSVINDNLFSIQAPDTAPGPAQNASVEEARSLLSLLLSLSKCPVIRYDAGSLALKRLASEVLYYINSNSNNNLFDDVNRSNDTPPTLVILDRRADPLTPLVTPWTYQSMVHELIGITRNVVNLPESGEQLTLSETQDAFFREAMYLNYGDLTDKFQKHVDDYKRQTKQSSIENLKTQDLTELKRILTRFPEFKKLSNNILKHLNIISDIDRQIGAQNLWAIGELQQTIVCDLESHPQIRARLMEMVSDASVSTLHKVKLLLLYVAKYPSRTADLDSLVAKLGDPVTTSPAPTLSQLLLLKNFSKHFRVHLDSAGPDSNSPENSNIGQLFNKNKIKIQQLFNTNVALNANRMPKNDNIYMQYVPKLGDILALLTAPASKAQLHSRENTPESLDLAMLVPDTVAAQYGSVDRLATNEIIVYFKGGVTYEEARLVHDLNALTPDVNYIVGGDRVLNSAQWVDQMCDEVNGSRGADGAQPDRRAQLREIL